MKTLRVPIVNNSYVVIVTVTPKLTTKTTFGRMVGQCAILFISIPLCPVINVDGFIPGSIHDARPEYTIHTLQAMIAPPELSHRTKVTGFISP